MDEALTQRAALAKGGAVTAAAAVQAQHDLAHHLIQRAEVAACVSRLLSAAM